MKPASSSSTNLSLSPSLQALQARLCGTEIGGYRVTRLIGYGGMGAVFEAQHRSREQRAAVKVLGFAGRPGDEAADAVMRFLDEAKALRAVRHRGLVRLFDSGQLPDGTVYMLMEYLAGESLSARLLRCGGRLPLGRALALLRQVASALCEVHDKGIVHRDLTPSNLFLVADEKAEGGERVKLLDFGIAKIRSGLARRTKTGECCGTPRYMAPEQCEGSAHIDDRADIYTLGVLLFELLTGQFPYTVASGDPLAWMFAHVSRRPYRLDQLAPGVPAEIARLAAQMLDKVPAQRPTAAQVVMRLRRHAQLTRRTPGAAADQAALVLVAGPRWSTWAQLLPTQRVLPTVALLAAGSCAVGFFGWQRLAGLPQESRSAQAAKVGAWAAPAPSGMVLIRGQRVVMGSSAAEVATALADCQQLGPPGAAPCRREPFEREQPERLITVSPFYLDQKEVTNREYADWLNRTPLVLKVRPDSHGQDRQLMNPGSPTPLLVDLYFADGKGSGLMRQAGRFVARPGFAELPVVQVTWHGARDYCLDNGRDLPSEAQWELAARGPASAAGGEFPRYPWGDDPPRCDGVWLAQPSRGGCAGGAGEDRGRPLAVGLSPQDQTASGVFDLGGNVSEWVRDRFVAPYPDCGPCLDPLVQSDSGDAGPGYRVVRGGSFTLTALETRSATRSRWEEQMPSESIGFRCAAGADSSAKSPAVR